MISTLAFHIFYQQKQNNSKTTYSLFTADCKRPKGQMYMRRTNTRAIKLQNLCFLDLRFWFCCKIMCLLIFEMLYLFLCLDRGINRTSRNILASGVQ